MIDLRSDTVTRPTEELRHIMAHAEVGDDVYGEDPSANALEAYAAEVTGHEAAVFVSSGTQGNLLGIMSHCERGDEYIVGQHAHTYKLEGGGAAILGSIQPQPLDQAADGTLPLDAVRDAIKPDDSHYARTRLLCLENTTSGRVLPLPYIDDARQLAQEHGLGFHLDGARVCNAAAKQGVPLANITSSFDTVSICLSKGLGAPVGSVLVGRAENIKRARRWRKVLGGGMRQAGIVAAAGLHVLKHNVDRMTDDHDNASHLAQGLSGLNGISVDTGAVQTNMVFAETDKDTAEALCSHLAAHGILVKPATRMRLVTHLDVSRSDIDTVISTVREYFAN
jgi:threonine aldolase